MMKPCADKQCRRAGKKLRLTEFAPNKHTSTGRGSYCRECFRRRNSEYMNRVRAQRRAKKIARKPMLLTPVAAVKNAIAKGCKTRNEIKAATRLPWDDLGVVLADLTFECQELRIVRVGEKREFHIAA